MIQARQTGWEYACRYVDTRRRYQLEALARARRAREWPAIQVNHLLQISIRRATLNFGALPPSLATPITSHVAEFRRVYLRHGVLFGRLRVRRPSGNAQHALWTCKLGAFTDVFRRVSAAPTCVRQPRESHEKISKAKVCCQSGSD